MALTPPVSPAMGAALVLEPDTVEALRRALAASVKAWREWSSLVDDLNAIESTDRGRRLMYGDKYKGLSPEDAALKAKIEARIAELEPGVMRDFPV